VLEALAASIAATVARRWPCRSTWADPASIERFAIGAVSAFGPVEVVVSNAARLTPGTALQTSRGVDRGPLAVNLVAAHRLVQAFVPGMVERRRV